MTTQRDDLAALIEDLDVCHDEDASDIANAILARYRLMGRHKCAYKADHDDIASAEETHCGTPLKHRDPLISVSQAISNIMERENTK